jgi:hypothetical protein
MRIEAHRMERQRFGVQAFPILCEPTSVGVAGRIVFRNLFTAPPELVVGR